MAQTRASRIKQMLLSEKEQTIHPDQSAVLHTFEDGWTIRAPFIASDFRREAKLMRNCVNLYVYKDLDDEKPFSMQMRDELKGEMKEHRLCSLRDTDNLPHASFWLVPHKHIFMALGYKNSALKPAYSQKLDAWAHLLGIENHGPMYSQNTISLQQLLDGQDIPEDKHPHLAPVPHAKRIDRLRRVIQDMQAVVEGCEKFPKDHDDWVYAIVQREIAQCILNIAQDGNHDIDELERMSSEAAEKYIDLDDKLFEEQRMAA